MAYFKIRLILISRNEQRKREDLPITLEVGSSDDKKLRLYLRDYILSKVEIVSEITDIKELTHLMDHLQKLFVLFPKEGSPEERFSFIESPRRRDESRY